MRPMFPSWMRSRNWRPRLVYFLAMEMTRRRLASTISFFARAAFCSPDLMRWTMCLSSGASAWASSSARLIFWRAPPLGRAGLDAVEEVLAPGRAGRGHLLGALDLLAPPPGEPVLDGPEARG